MRLSYIFFSFIFIVAPFYLWAQSAIELPPTVTFTPGSLPLIFVSSSLPDTTKTEIKIGNISGLGDFADFRIFYGYFRTGFGRNDGGYHFNNQIGIKFSSDQEGKYLSKTRVYAFYSRHVVISEDRILALGIAAGVFNINAITSNSAGGSDIKPDLEGSITYYTPNLEISFALGQGLNNTIRPTYREIKMQRHVQGFFQWSRILSDKVILKPFGMVRGYSFDQSGYWQIGTSFNVDDKIELGVSINSFQKMVPVVGFKVSRFLFNIAYTFPYRSTGSSIGQQFEIGIKSFF